MRKAPVAGSTIRLAEDYETSWPKLSGKGPSPEGSDEARLGSSASRRRRDRRPAAGATKLASKGGRRSLPEQSSTPSLPRKNALPRRSTKVPFLTSHPALTLAHALFWRRRRSRTLRTRICRSGTRTVVARTFRGRAAATPWPRHGYSVSPSSSSRRPLHLTGQVTNNKRRTSHRASDPVRVAAASRPQDETNDGAPDVRSLETQPTHYPAHS